MRDTGKLILIGSIARPEDGWTVEDVFSHCAQAVGGLVNMLPDGELDDRSLWINFIARQVFPHHPDLITTSRHTYQDWKPAGYDDLWRVTVRKGVENLRFDRIGYADAATASYAVFRRLRDEGVIPAHVRFMVALPLTESGTRGFVDNARDFELLWNAYRDVMRREIEAMLETIPEDDLAIQWDLARETAAIEGVEFQFTDQDLRSLPTDPLERYVHALSELASAIPEPVWLGLHVCYGSLEHKAGESPDSGHYVPITDLGTAVDMLNAGVSACGRGIDFAHAPVQFSEGLRDDHYAALERLDIGDARMYLGLIDPTDGVEGALRRVAVARRHVEHFGLGTACGWGRRPLNESVQGILNLESEVAQRIWGAT